MNIIAPINDFSYGYVSQEILYNLNKLGQNVTLFPIGPYAPSQKYQFICDKSCQNQEFWNTHSPSLRIFHEFDLALHAGSPKIGFSFFELNRLTRRQLNHLNQQDLIFVATHWAKNILEQHKVPSDKINIVPLGISDDFIPDINMNPGNKCIFLNIGKWEYRKGHDILPRLLAAALPNEDYELWMFPNTPFCSEIEVAKAKNQYKTYLGNKVKFFNRVGNIADIIKRVHCGIFISRAEGWNLGCLETMAMGKEVIVTNYSGHTEFCNEQNSHLIHINELETADDGKWFHGYGEWAKLGDSQQDQIIEAIRKSYENFQNGSFVNRAGIQAGQKFTFENTARIILKTLGALC